MPQFTQMLLSVLNQEDMSATARTCSALLADKHGVNVVSVDTPTSDLIHSDYP